MSWRLAARSTSVLWGIALTAFVLAAVVVLASRAADQARGPLVATLRDATGLPLEVARLGLGWRGLNPTITLQGLQVEAEDAPASEDRVWLEAEAVAVTWQWVDLLRGRLQPYRLRLDGATLRLTDSARAWWAARERRPQSQSGVSLQLAFRDLRIVQPAADRLLPRALDVYSGWVDWLPGDDRIEGQAKARLNPGGAVDGTPPEALLLDLEGQWDGEHAWLRIAGLDSGIDDAPVVIVKGDRQEGYWRGAVGPAHELAPGPADPWFDWVAGPDGLQWSGDSVPLAVLAPVMRALVPLLADDWTVSGALSDVRGDWRWQPIADQPRLSLQARLQAVHLQGPSLQLTDLNGYVALNERGGYFQPAAAAPALTLSGWTQPLALDRLRGQWMWHRHHDQSWRIAAPELEIETLGARAAGHLFAIAGGGLPVEVDLGLDLAADNVAAVHPYWPPRWPESLRGWLERSVLAASLDDGRLEISGPLADFPFVDRPTGQWHLALPLRDGRLRFAPDWPAVTELAAVARFTGMSLSVAGIQGQLGALSVQSASARIPVFDRQPVLYVEAEARDAAQDFLETLAASPLQQRFRGMIETLRPKGSAGLDLALEIPLTDVKRSRAAGLLQVDDSSLDLREIDTPFQSVAGQVQFDGDDLSGSFAARWQGAPVEVVLTGDAAGANVALSGTDLPVEALGQWVPPPVLATLSGVLDWTADLELPRLNGSPKLTAHSTLEGVTAGMPRPLVKSAAEARPLRLEVPLGGQSDQPISLSVDGDWLQGRFFPERTELRLGTGSAELTADWDAGPGLWLAADLDHVAADDWVAWLSGFQKSKAEPTPRTALAGGVFEVRQLTWGRWSMGPQRAELTMNGEGWQAELSGAASGSLDRFSGGHLAQFERLEVALQLPDEDAPAPPAPRGTPAAPDQPLPKGLRGSWTGQAERFVLNGLDMGQLALTGTLEARDAMQFDVALAGGGVTGTAQFGHDGVLRVSRGQLETADPAAVLEAFERTPPFDAGRGGLSWTLAWPASTTELSIPNAEGDMSVWMRDGRLRAVDPGAGRLLGLFSFYQLPKRFLLDFRDVTDDGMAFDSLDAGLRLDRGRVLIDEMSVRAPSLRMAVRGETHLLTRALDQQVTVYPALTGGASLGAALLGGPAVGILVLLAQTLLDKPLDAAGQFGYRITGTWDAPEIQRLDADSAAPSSEEGP